MERRHLKKSLESVMKIEFVAVRDGSGVGVPMVLESYLSLAGENVTRYQRIKLLGHIRD